MRECDNSKIYKGSNLLLSRCLIIMLDTKKKIFTKGENNKKSIMFEQHYLRAAQVLEMADE